MSALEFDDVVKHYRTGGEVVRAVDGVSLVVGTGEFVALYGPSGSGKTTLLLLAASLLSPDSGTIRFDGREVSQRSERERAIYRRREVGFIFQGSHFMDSASALDNAALKLVGDGWSPAEARRAALPWLQRVGLGRLAKQAPSRLSAGERQRVAIARALVNTPSVLLADEPTGNLDADRSRQIFSLIRDLCHEGGLPALLVTHDPEALAYVDRAHSLRDGQLVESGLEVARTER